MPPAPIRGLYVLIDPESCAGRDPVEVARLALAGGAAMLQWRDKRRDKGEQLDQARAIRELCAGHEATFIVNDHVDLALVLDADGVHLGQHDLPVAAVRPLVPPGFVVGVSTNNVDEARRAQADGASYVAVGSIFLTDTKDVTRPASLERLREVKAAVDPSTLRPSSGQAGPGQRLPVVAIGGIDATNIDRVLAAGADAVAVISTVCAADDVTVAARELASRFETQT